MSQDEDAATTLRDAAELYRPLARAARIARGNGGLLMTIGGLSALFGLFGPDVMTLITGLVAAAIGWQERRDAERLRRGEPDAPGALARDELVLLGAITIYCALNLTLLRPSAAELEAAAGGALPGLDLQALMDALTNAVYPTLFVVSVLFQGGLARYYGKQRAAVDRYRTTVPDWAREAVESVSG